MLSGHSYPVVGFFENVGVDEDEESVDLVKLHNPWGTSIDNFGEWSNDSAKWTPRLREELGCLTNDDTFFFMTFDDYYTKHKRTSFVLTVQNIAGDHAEDEDLDQQPISDELSGHSRVMHSYKRESRLGGTSRPAFFRFYPERDIDLS